MQQGRPLLAFIPCFVWAVACGGGEIDVPGPGDAGGRGGSPSAGAGGGLSGGGGSPDGQGAGGASGQSGASGQAGTSGQAGASGQAGESGAAGAAGLGGAGGAAGQGGEGGAAGQGGSGGAAGQGGTGGTAGQGGEGGAAGQGGAGGAAGQGGEGGGAGASGQGGGGAGGAPACPPRPPVWPTFTIRRVENARDLHGLNDKGEAVGRDYDPLAGEDSFWATLWLPAAAYGLRPGTHKIGPEGVAFSRAYAINEAGQAVGFQHDGFGSPTRGFLWSAAAGAVDLPPLPGDGHSYAFGINDAGVVVGQSERIAPEGVTKRAVRWLGAGAPEDLGAILDSTYLYGNAINELGAIAGSAVSADFVDLHAYLWLPEPRYGLPAGMNDLGPGDGLGVNDAGHVVGSFGNGRAARWVPQGDPCLPPGATDLHALVPGGPWDATTAQAVAPGGDVVGVAVRTEGFGNVLRAVLWRGGEARVLQDLVVNPEGWQIESALAINARGEIAGFGIYQGDQAGAGFVLTPVR